MPPNDQDLLADLTTDDGSDGSKPRPVARRIHAATLFAAKIENRMTKVDQFLAQGPPIDPQTMTDLQALQSSVSHILTLTNGILARYAQ